MLFMVPKAQKLEIGFRDAVEKACDLATAAGSKEAAVAVHVRQSADSSIIRDAIGERAMKELVKGSTVVRGATLHLMTERIKSNLVRGPIIAAYIAPELLAKVLQDKRATDIIFLPWNEKEETAFHKKYAPAVISAPSGWQSPGTIDPDDANDKPKKAAASKQVGRTHAITIEQMTADTSMAKPHVVLLGAGASFAACPRGDRAGKALPLMSNLTQLLPLEALVPEEARGNNFEAYYGAIADDALQSARVRAIERVIYEYFASLVLPSRPTIYDYLLLSLRSKDVIATFNWDPFLLQAARRNAKLIGDRLPQLLFLHGNVLEGVCEKDRVLGWKGVPCSLCGTPLEGTPLLYPIGKKNYSERPALADTWQKLASAFKNAFMITIFGYSAPKSDADAISLLKQAWGELEERQFEQFEVIDIRRKKGLIASWKDFIHTHHYEIHRDFFKSSLARHPRRTGEDFLKRIMLANWTTPNPPPRKVGLSQLQDWYRPLIEAERGT